MKRLPVILVVIVVVAAALWNGIVRSAPEPGLYHGVVEAEQAQMAFEIGGRIATLSVHEGETVSAGQELAQLEHQELEAGLKAAQATQQTDKRAAEIAMVEYDLQRREAQRKRYM